MYAKNIGTVCILFSRDFLVVASEAPGENDVALALYNMYIYAFCVLIRQL